MWDNNAINPIVVNGIREARKRTIEGGCFEVARSGEWNIAGSGLCGSSSWHVHFSLKKYTIFFEAGAGEACPKSKAHVVRPIRSQANSLVQPDNKNGSTRVDRPEMHLKGLVERVEHRLAGITRLTHNY